MIRRLGIRRAREFFKVIKNLGKPSAAVVPGELIPDGILMMSRGAANFVTFHLLHNWVLPWWAGRQLDPADPAYQPRGMNLAWTNCAHRNWTAAGPLGGKREAVVDPRGLTMVWRNGPSYEFWASDGGEIWTFPSQLERIDQAVDAASGTVKTTFTAGALALETAVWGGWHSGQDVLRIDAQAVNRGDRRRAVLGFALRPFNVEGVAPVHAVRVDDGRGTVDGRPAFATAPPPERVLYSTYADGDVAWKVARPEPAPPGQCRAGLATAVLLFERELEPGEALTVKVALTFAPEAPAVPAPAAEDPAGSDAKTRERWRVARAGGAAAVLPPGKLRDCTEANLSYLLLFDDGDSICPGPYTYHTYWFRDSAYLINALDAWGFHASAKEKLASYPGRQRPNGFYRSQNGEWDSNGQAIWTVMQHYRWTGDVAVLRQQFPALMNGARWIIRERMKTRSRGQPHWGLLPAGFSAEHLGPSDHYFWDAFWGLAGLRDAAAAAAALEQPAAAAEMAYARDSFRRDIDRVIGQEAVRLGRDLIPAAPGRHWDGGAIGAVAAYYPLGLYPAGDRFLSGTAGQLLADFGWNGLYRHEVVHSGVNIYLSCHLAQHLLGLRDPRVWAMAGAMLDAATATWTWPEAIHPRTGGGAMGDGHHGWAMADWLLLVRNLLLVEEGRQLVLLPVPHPDWPGEQAEVGMNGAPTHFGPVSFVARFEERAVDIEWSSRFRERPLAVEAALPGPFLRAEGSAGPGSQPNRAALDGPAGRARLYWDGAPSRES